MTMLLVNKLDKELMQQYILVCIRKQEKK